MVIKFQIPLFWKIFALTLLIIPISINANRMLKYVGSLGFHSGSIALIGGVILGAIFVIIVIFCKQDASKKEVVNWHLYVFSQFAVTSVISFGIGLEQDGYISDFVSEYLKNGEPYLYCPYGRITCYFDGFPTYFMYLFMIYAIAYKKNYRSIALYWVGTLLNSMVVLFIGVLWGKHGLFPSSMLNLPYLIAPIAVASSLIHENSSKKISTQTQRRSSLYGVTDTTLVIMLIIAVVVTILRGTAIMENNISIAKNYLSDIEPYLSLNDPSPFLKIQILVYLFYILPIYALSIYGIIYNKIDWIKDATLLHAGIMCQGQVACIATIVHPEIQTQFQSAGYIFWFVNIFIVLLPHLILLRCYCMQTSVVEVASKRKIN